MNNEQILKTLNAAIAAVQDGTAEIKTLENETTILAPNNPPVTIITIEVEH